MKLAAQPNPSSARAMTSMSPVVAIACTRLPATMKMLTAAVVMRTPMRSNATPTATCVSKSARKNAPLASPSVRDDRSRSRINSGAITANDERKNCDRMVVAASMAISGRRAKGEA